MEECYKSSALNDESINAETANELNNAAHRLTKNGDYRKAFPFYERAISINACADIHFNYGYALHKAGLLDRAAKEYQAAINLDGNMAKAFNNLGVLLNEQGDISASIDCHRAAIGADHFYSPARINLARRLTSSGKIEEAFVEYQNLLELEPDFVEAHHSFALTLAMQGRLNEAIEHFKQVIRLKPNFPDIHMNLALAYVRYGCTEQAITELETHIRLHRGDWCAYNETALCHLILAYESMSKEECLRAVSYFLQSLRINPVNLKGYWGLINCLKSYLILYTKKHKV